MNHLTYFTGFFRQKRLEALLSSIQRNADLGNDIFQCVLAKYFRDREENALVEHWYQSSADQGNVVAQRCFYLFSSAENKPKRISYLIKAADQGCVESCAFLGFNYTSNSGILEHNAEKGIFYYRRAAVLGRIQPIARYYQSLGNMPMAQYYARLHDLEARLSNYEDRLLDGMGGVPRARAVPALSSQK